MMNFERHAIRLEKWKLVQTSLISSWAAVNSWHVVLQRSTRGRKIIAGCREQGTRVRVPRLREVRIALFAPGYDGKYRVTCIHGEEKFVESARG